MGGQIPFLLIAMQMEIVGGTNQEATNALPKIAQPGQFSQM